MTRLFGIPNCDTVKKARIWLEAQGLAYEFCDLRRPALQIEQVEHWLAMLGADGLINKRSTSWRQLSAHDQTQVLSAQPFSVLLANPTLIKRPLLEHAAGIYTGFSPAQYTQIFNR